MQRIPPRPGQESVWDYPRPPALDQSAEHIVVTLGGSVVAETRTAWRVLETSHPPTYYLPRASFDAACLRDAAGTSYCEWKGIAAYLDILGGDQVAARSAWYYPTPDRRYAVLYNHIALYPGAMEMCTVDGEQVQPQSGNFYGGWITSRITGPFKGTPGTSGW